MTGMRNHEYGVGKMGGLESRWIVRVPMPPYELLGFYLIFQIPFRRSVMGHQAHTHSLTPVHPPPQPPPHPANIRERAPGVLGQRGVSALQRGRGYVFFSIFIPFLLSNVFGKRTLLILISCSRAFRRSSDRRSTLSSDSFNHGGRWLHRQ